MRISAKGRYALASVASMAQQYDLKEHVTVLSISEKLEISKIYLEQVFSLLKRAGIVSSTKGAQGGYQLRRMPKQITVYDVLCAVELTLFEKTSETVENSAPELEKALQLSAFEILDKTVTQTLSAITIQDIVDEWDKNENEQQIMFYI